MSADYLIDTNIWISVIRGDQRIRGRLAALQGRAMLSLIVWGELQTGLNLDPERRQQAALDHIRRGASIKHLTADVAESYGALRALLRREGLSIGHNDTWIAAEALALDQTVVTLNGRHFTRIPGLTVEDWGMPSPA